MVTNGDLPLLPGATDAVEQDVGASRAVGVDANAQAGTGALIRCEGVRSSISESSSRCRRVSHRATTPVTAAAARSVGTAPDRDGN